MDQGKEKRWVGWGEGGLTMLHNRTRNQKPETRKGMLTFWLMCALGPLNTMLRE